jgi:hypothetical protein
MGYQWALNNNISPPLPEGKEREEKYYIPT